MQRIRPVAAILALALLGSGFTPTIQDPAQGTHGFALQAGEHDLLDLIDRVAAYLGRNILVDDPAMRAGLPGGMSVLSVQNRIEVDAPGCEDLLSQLLYMKGFALVPMDRSKELYEVIAMQGPRRSEIMSRAVVMSPEEVLRRPHLKMPVMTTLSLEHINAQVATNALRPFFASSPRGAALTIGNLGTRRAILLSGFADEVGAAIRVVREGDVEPLEPDAALEDPIDALERRIARIEEKVGN